MKFKHCQLIFILSICCLLLLGCSSNSTEAATVEATETTVSDLDEIYEELERISQEIANISEQFPDDNVDVSDTHEEELVSETESGLHYLPADWSDEVFKRDGCTSHSLILDTPLEGCKGFTVDYDVSDVDGRMKADSKFQIFYRTADGTWVKGKQFYLDNWSASVEQTIKKPVTVTEVTVICLNSGNFSWSITMGIKDPVY